MPKLVAARGFHGTFTGLEMGVGQMAISESGTAAGSAESLFKVRYTAQVPQSIARSVLHSYGKGFDTGPFKFRAGVLIFCNFRGVWLFPLGSRQVFTPTLSDVRVYVLVAVCVCACRQKRTCMILCDRCQPAPVAGAEWAYVDICGPWPAVLLSPAGQTKLGELIMQLKDRSNSCPVC